MGFHHVVREEKLSSYTQNAAPVPKNTMICCSTDASVQLTMKHEIHSVHVCSRKKTNRKWPKTNSHH